EEVRLYAMYGSALAKYHIATTSEERACCIKEFTVVMPLLAAKGEHTLWQECSWHTYCLHNLQGSDTLARDELHTLLEYAKKTNSMKAEPTLFATCALAKEHMKNEDVRTAAELLDAAEKLHADSVNRELLLTVWLTQSDLLKKKQNLDAAM